MTSIVNFLGLIPFSIKIKDSNYVIKDKQTTPRCEINQSIVTVLCKPLSL